MSLTLTIADLQDGTGAAATVSGSDAGQTVTVYTQADIYTVFGSSGTWASAGSRVGNGTLTLSLDPSYYHAYAAGVVGAQLALSGVVRFKASRADEATFTRIKNGVIAGLQSIEFTGPDIPGPIPVANIKWVETFDWDAITVMKLPAILAAPAPTPETQPGETTAQDDVGYAVAIMIVDRRAPTEDSSGLVYDTYRMWRQQIRHFFLSQRLGGVSEQFLCELEPKTPNAWRAGYDLYGSEQWLRFRAREGRGV